MFAQVIVPLRVPGAFTYQIPQELIDDCAVGKRVVISFGKKIFSGVVLSISDQKPDNFEVKSILDVLDALPIVNNIQLKFWQFISDYYICNLGEVLSAALPSSLKPESETLISLTDAEIDQNSLKVNELKIVLALKAKPFLKISQLEKITGQKNNLKTISKLISLGFVQSSTQIEEKYKLKQEKYICLSDDFCKEGGLKNLFDKIEKKYPQQLQILLFYLSSSKTRLVNNCVEKANEIPISVFKKNPSLSQSALNTLIKNKVFDCTLKDVDKYLEYLGQVLDSQQLTDVQIRALNDINLSFENNNTTLLFGVNGSGKTEIYIKLIQEQIQKGKQVLYLLPEIVLSSQIIRRLQKIFGNSLAIYHNKISQGDRLILWQNLLKSDSQNQYKIIVGVKQSLFLPFDNLGLIIVDEEHHEGYKQKDPAPRFHGRDCAIVLANFYGAKVLLGTATPSIETYYNALNGKYGLVELSKRFDNYILPQIVVSNLRDAQNRKEMKSLFSLESYNNILSTFRDNKQTIVYRNHRGFSPYIQCSTCGWIPVCENCDVSLTYHRKENTLVCHHCGYTIDMVNTCSACTANTLITKGYGTEQIEDQLKLLIPEAKISRLDADVAQSKKRFESIIEDFEKGKIDILTGTKILSHGFDFKNLHLGVILDADNFLNFPDFRAQEHAFAFFMQVAGRLSRSNQVGKLIIQTSKPENEIFSDVTRFDYKKFYHRTCAERSTFMYPPYSKLIVIKLKHKDAYTLQNSANLLANTLRPTFKSGVLGPEEPFVSRIQNYFIQQITLKIPRQYYGKQAKDIVRNAINYTFNMALKADLRISIDVDPI